MSEYVLGRPKNSSWTQKETLNRNKQKIAEDAKRDEDNKKINKIKVVQSEHVFGRPKKSRKIKSAH